MHDLKVSPSEAKRRLLDAAEQLFAERGFEAVSVRDITQRAKANVAAINYHFGTREGLLALVITRYLTPVNDERLARLELLERRGGGKTVAPEEIIEAFVRPLVASGRKSELPEPLCCQLLGHIFALPLTALPAPLGEQGRVLNDRFIRALAKALPAVAGEEWLWRSRFMEGALIQLLRHQDGLPQVPAGAGGSSMEATMGRLIRFVAAGMRDGAGDAEAVVKKGPQATFDF